MGQGIFRAVSGSLAQMRRLDVLANNLAHSDTPGYKADRLRFEEVLDAAGRRTRFVNTPETSVQLSQGSLKRTDNPLDMAVVGDGFFVVDTPAGRQLTRAGRFVVGTDSNLRTTDGHMVIGDAGPIAVPPPSAGGSGKVVVHPNGNLEMDGFQLGRIKRVKAEAGQLRKTDGQRFAVVGEVDVDALPSVESGEVLQGHLEEANVNPVISMTQMVQVQRSFEALNQAIRVYREVETQSSQRLK